MPHGVSRSLATTSRRTVCFSLFTTAPSGSTTNAGRVRRTPLCVRMYWVSCQICVSLKLLNGAMAVFGTPLRIALAIRSSVVDASHFSSNRLGARPPARSVP